MSKGIYWTKEEDKRLRELVRDSMDAERRIVSRSTWEKIGREVSKVSGIKRTYEACRTRATGKRLCAPLKTFSPNIRNINAEKRGALSVFEQREIARQAASPKLATAAASTYPAPPPVEWRGLFSGLLRQIVADEIAKPESVLHASIRETVTKEVQRQLEDMFK